MAFLRGFVQTLAEKQRLLVLVLFSILAAGLIALYIREFGAAIVIFLLIPIGVAAKDYLRLHDSSTAPNDGAPRGDAIIGNVTDSTNVTIGKDIHIHLGAEAEDAQTAQADFELRNWQRNRENVLRNMQNTWVDGYLRHAVHQEIYMLLHKEYKPNALLRRPWNLELQPERQMVPAETHIYDLYIQHGRNLLILGEPASGKTITLMQLAEMLIIEAQIDATAPIPVVINLSSWARAQLPLEEWLAEELLVQYQIARNLTLSWLVQNHLTLLMDGLDEVAPPQRDACVTEINRFKERSPAHLVVCSRLEDYSELNQRLNLTTAIVIQPLMPPQIADYLARFGAQTTGIRAALDHDLELQELAESPLMLSLMPVAYGDVSEDHLLSARTVEQQRRRLFNHYVARVFQHRPLPERHPYVQVQALNWLINLAHGMKRHDLTSFYIERLQPSWLARTTSNPSPKIDGEPIIEWLGRFIGGAIVALSSGAIVGLRDGLSSGVLFGLIGALIGGLIFGLSETLLKGLGDKDIDLGGKLYWTIPTWPRFTAEVKRGLIDGLKSGIVLGLSSGVFGGLIFGMSIGVMLGLRSGLYLGAVGGLLSSFIGALMLGLNAFIYSSESTRSTRPNQGVRIALRNACLYGLSVGTLFGLVFGLCAGLVLELYEGLLLGLIVGLSVGFLQYGGRAVIQHYVLRILLAQRHILPYPLRDAHLVAWLDDMVGRILLRRVGGGWVFIHRYLLDHFADQHPTYK